MARSIRAVTLENRAARAKLKPRKKPYWKLVDRNCYIGYYRGAKSGSWVARYHTGNSRYNEKVIEGTPDDVQDADGMTVFNFFQAQGKAREWFTEQARKQAGIEVATPKTFRQAAAEYLEWFKTHRKSYDFARQSLELHIYPEFGDIELSRITTRKIQSWLNDFSESKPKARRKLGAKDNNRNTPFDSRQRKATANRQLTILKAVLNFAFRHGYVTTDQQWKRVKPFHGVDIAKIRYLSEAECNRLVNACPEDFRRLVQGALYSGCRFGELIALKAGDFDPDAHTLHIQVSKSGKPRHVALSDDGARFFTDVTAGKQSSDIIFIKTNGKAWRKTQQIKRIEEACANAEIKPAISFHVLRHTYAASLAMRGVTLQVIAVQLGHSDTRICEKHYAHLSPSYLADTIKGSLPNLGFMREGTVIPIRA